MMKTITVRKPDMILRGTIPLPSSKSISNRLLILRALAEEPFLINNLSRADDTLLLDNLLAGISGKNKNKPYIELDTGNAGTAMRFLTAYLSLLPGKWVLTGSDRMKQRPVGPLVDALRSCGADIEYLSKLGYPPLMIKGRSLKGGEISIDPGISSQFISALLMIAPRIPGGLIVSYQGPAVSLPYIDMTVRLLNYFGIETGKERNKVWVKEGSIKKREYTVESDWSSAAFWYEAAALSGKLDITLEGLHKNSLQGDSIIVSIYQNFGIHTEFIPSGIRLTRFQVKPGGYYFNFSNHPDIAPPVITTCASLGFRGRFEGLKNLRIKESDRVNALRMELSRIGIEVEPGYALDIEPKIDFPPSRINISPEHKIDTYNDHRMAMTFAPLAIKFGSIKIENPDVVSKSYPQFWDHMSLLGFEIS